jgi:hypothetical protein
MAKIIIEIEDTFPSRCENIFEEVIEIMKSYKEDNPEESFPDLGTLDYSGDIHEIVDRSVPVYTKEILDIWYLYRQELLSAYEDAGDAAVSGFGEGAGPAARPYSDGGGGD